MRNGQACLCRVMKLRREMQSVGAVKRQVVVKRWRGKGREGSERRGRAGRSAPAVGRERRGRAGMLRPNSAEEIVSFARTGKHLGEAGQ